GLDAAELQRGQPVRAVQVQHAQPARAVAKQHELLAEQLDLARLGLHLLAEVDRPPVAPQQLAAGRPGADSREGFVLFLGEHVSSWMTQPRSAPAWTAVSSSMLVTSKVMHALAAGSRIIPMGSRPSSTAAMHSRSSWR